MKIVRKVTTRVAPLEKVVPPVIEQREVAKTERPLPTGSDIAHKKPPLQGAPVTSVMGVRMPSGPALLERRFDEIERLVKQGETVRCVFDLDNTLFDTRGRTLHALKEFDARNKPPTSYFKDLDAGGVLEDGRKTAAALHLPPDVIEAAGKVWDKAFWDPKNLVHDTVMTQMVEIVREAQKRGAEIVFLTGRTEDHGFRQPTREQLERAGLVVDDANLLLKPSLNERTAQYKESEMRRLCEDATLGFFLTEGRRDMDHLAKVIDKFTGFLLDASFEEGGPGCAGVPVLPRIF